jgi:hypothetical protein
MADALGGFVESLVEAVLKSVLVGLLDDLIEGPKTGPNGTSREAGGGIDFVGKGIILDLPPVSSDVTRVPVVSGFWVVDSGGRI